MLPILFILLFILPNFFLFQYPLKCMANGEHSGCFEGQVVRCCSEFWVGLQNFGPLLRAKTLKP